MSAWSSGSFMAAASLPEPEVVCGATVEHQGLPGQVGGALRAEADDYRCDLRLVRDAAQRDRPLQLAIGVTVAGLAVGAHDTTGHGIHPALLRPEVDRQAG